MMTLSRRLLTLVAPVLLTIPGPAWAQVRLVGLGSTPGGGLVTEAQDISADGTVVIGRGFEGAIRWTESGGVENLGQLATFGTSYGYGVSADGGVVVGSSDSRAVKWDGNGLTAVVPNPASGSFARATDVSADGSVVVGRNGSGWFRYTEADGLDFMGLSTGEARAVSADGSIVVGIGRDVTGPFRWTQSGGQRSLGFLPGDTLRVGFAEGISPDGAVIVGEASSPDGRQAFRWTEESGMVDLGNRATNANYMISGLDASEDGGVIVGFGIAEAGGPIEAMIWDDQNGVRHLETVLQVMGVDTRGWQLARATAVSYDGRHLVGWGTNPEGDREAFLAVIPEPNTALLLGLGLFALSTRRDRA